MKLLTCPFCGHAPAMIHRKLWREYFVACQNSACAARVGFLATTHMQHVHRAPQSAAAAWNTSKERDEVACQLIEV